MQSTASQKIIGMARRLRVAAWLAAFACLAVTALAVLMPAAGTAPVAAMLSSGGLPRAWAGGIALLLAALSAAALIELARMLGRLQAQAWFSAAVVRHFRRFAGLLALTALLRVLLPPLATIALAWQVGRHAAALTFDGGDLLALLPASVFFLVARLFDEAARLEDDSRSIV
jgi:hypothetical protein